MSENQETIPDIEKDIKYLIKLVYCLIIIFLGFVYSIWLRVLL